MRPLSVAFGSGDGAKTADISHCARFRSLYHAEKTAPPSATTEPYRSTSEWRLPVDEHSTAFATQAPAESEDWFQTPVPLCSFETPLAHVTNRPAREGDAGFPREIYHGAAVYGAIPEGAKGVPRLWLDLYDHGRNFVSLALSGASPMRPAVSKPVADFSEARSRSEQVFLAAPRLGLGGSMEPQEPEVCPSPPRGSLERVPPSLSCEHAAGTEQMGQGIRGRRTSLQARRSQSYQKLCLGKGAVSDGSRHVAPPPSLSFHLRGGHQRWSDVENDEDHTEVHMTHEKLDLLLGEATCKLQQSL